MDAQTVLWRAASAIGNVAGTTFDRFVPSRERSRDAPSFCNPLAHRCLQSFNYSIRNIRRFVLTLFPVIFYKSRTLPWATGPGG